MGKGGRLVVPWVLLTVAVAAACGTAAVDAAWRHEFGRPRVVLLSSGEAALSVLVTAGDARLLLVNGNDPVSFGDALATVRRPTMPRLDVVLLTAVGGRLLGAPPLGRLEDARLVAAIGVAPQPPPGVGIEGDAWPVVTASRRFRLADGVEVTVESVPPAATASQSEAAAPAWRMVVKRGGSVVEILSDGGVGERFAATGAVSARVVAGGAALAAVGDDPAPVLAAADGALNGEAVRDRVAEGLPMARWQMVVHAGEAASLGLTDAGVTIEGDEAERAVPEADGG